MSEAEIEDLISQVSARDLEDIKFAQHQVRTFAQAQRDSMLDIEIETLPGVILGSAGYLSPEQARGRVVDKRTDVWSFGCVLFEMLSGAPLFPGETVTDSIGATLHKEPAKTSRSTSVGVIGYSRPILLPRTIAGGRDCAAP